MRVGKWHILGPTSHVFIAFLVGRIFVVAMEIWNCVFVIYMHLQPAFSYPAPSKWRGGSSTACLRPKELNF